MVIQEWVAPELFNDLLCFCKANKYDDECFCQLNQQPCTAACSGDSFCTLETMPNIVREYDSESDSW